MTEELQKEILIELKDIKQELDYIKKHIIDRDTILTSEEEEKLNQSLKEWTEGKTISFDKFKKKMGV